MATTDGKTVHPDTPKWFIPYWEENARQHQELRTELQAELHTEVGKLHTEISKIPQRVIEGLQNVRSTGGGNAYSHDPKDSS
ncbi:hypothetical protein F4Y93_00435 [Candidatus Poribacteria bacterium]|nr:hypothetical protein [Candidatus Poribacteria bacterium]